MATKQRKNPAAAALGRKGGTARAAKLSVSELSAIGKAGAAARWGTARAKKAAAASAAVRSKKAAAKKKAAKKAKGA